MMGGIGIDFGTSTTLVATSKVKGAEILRTADGSEVTPSYVSFPPDNQILVGYPARQRRIIDPNNTLYAFKRILGRTCLSSEFRAYKQQYPFQLEANSDNLPHFVTRLGKVSPTEITSHLLRSLRTIPQAVASNKVVMTIPVTFKTEQRTALLGAAVQAGFHHIHLMEEPSAAAYAVLHQDDRAQTVAIYDLGGGTFDITLLEWSKGHFRILGLAGDSYLGGDDITYRFALLLQQAILETHRWHVNKEDVTWLKLLQTCEHAKIMLSSNLSYDINLATIDPLLEGKSITIHRQALQQACAELVQRSFVTCDEAMRKAGLAVSKIQTVILSGGCCYIPWIKEHVQHYFQQQPRTLLPPDKIVALGAAIATSRTQNTNFFAQEKWESGLGTESGISRFSNM